MKIVFLMKILMKKKKKQKKHIMKMMKNIKNLKNSESIFLIIGITKIN